VFLRYIERAAFARRTGRPHLSTIAGLRPSVEFRPAEPDDDAAEGGAPHEKHVIELARSCR
jgi:hypothetical protein